MDALARQNVGQTDSRRQYLHPNLACPWTGDVFFSGGDYFGAAVLTDDNSLVSHYPEPLALFWPNLITHAPSGAVVRELPEHPERFLFAQADIPRLSSDVRLLGVKRTSAGPIAMSAFRPRAKMRCGALPWRTTQSSLEHVVGYLPLRGSL